MDRPQLLADLMQGEGFRPNLYDDASGAPLTKGSVIHGWPTIGYGWNVASRPCPQDLAQYILGYFADDTWNTLILAASWISSQPEPVQRALCEMAFNEGVTGLLKFNTFLALVQQGNYAEAADDLETTLWAKQVGVRAARIQALIKHGATA